HEIPMVTIPLVATAILSVSMGIFPGYFLALAEGVVR
ncbi:MAG: NADH-quinone oxidoreductase subunit N, partial [Mesorhizobium sp.]